MTRSATDGRDWRSWVPAFDAWAATYDDDTGDPWLRYEAAWSFVLRSLNRGLGQLGGRSVVDVGCGTGEFVRRLTDEGAVATGVDPSSGMRTAAARKVKQARFLDGHLTAVPLADGSTDAAIATYVVSHLPPIEQPAALAELGRVVRPGGTIVVVDVPVAAGRALDRARAVLEEAGRGTHVAWYEDGNGLDIDAWRAGLERSGRDVAVEHLGPLLVGVAGLRPERSP